MRTYLYVDGENFAIRAQAFDDELKADPNLSGQWRGRFPRLRESYGSNYDATQARFPSWSPEPQRDARYNTRPWTKSGIVYVKDETYWDSLGLHIATEINFPIVFDDIYDYFRREVPLDRANYYASVSGSDGMSKAQQTLHAIGFTPHVFQRSKPDSWAKDLAAQGIRVVSRPKPLDIFLAAQVLEDAYSDNFDRCIFVAGDEDYVPLVEAVRRRGKQVWLVAFERWLPATSRLRLNCDRFIAYDGVLAFRSLPTT